MQRNSIHDIKPSIKLRKSKGYESRRLEHDEEETYEEEPVSKREKDIYDHPYMYEKKSSGRAIWYVAAFCILFLIFALSFLFAGATVEVTPRVGNIEVNKLIVAHKNPVDSKSLSFEIATLEGDESTTVTNTEKKYVERKGTGTVRLYNNHSTTAQKLLIDTRLEAPDGKIYKTEKAVTIPGQKVVDGKKTPGSIEVGIYADAVGEEYNKKETDFKIFGFKGTPKSETIYARSTTEIVGGFKGDTFALSAEEDASLRKTLEESLKQSLLDKARAELPEGFILYDDVTILDTEEPKVTASETGTELTQTGKLHAFIFKEENLTRELVSNAVADFDNNKVYIEGLEDISFELMSKSEINPSQVDSISVSVKGDAKIIWEIDEEGVKDALVGIKQRKFEPTLREFKNIDMAELSIKPFWKNSLPSKRDQIEIINTIERE